MLVAACVMFQDDRQDCSFIGKKISITSQSTKRNHSSGMKLSTVKWLPRSAIFLLVSPMHKHLCRYITKILPNRDDYGMCSLLNREGELGNIRSCSKVRVIPLFNPNSWRFLKIFHRTQNSWIK